MGTYTHNHRKNKFHIMVYLFKIQHIAVLTMYNEYHDLFLRNKKISKYMRLNIINQALKYMNTVLFGYSGSKI